MSRGGQPRRPRGGAHVGRPARQAGARPRRRRALLHQVRPDGQQIAIKPARERTTMRVLSWVVLAALGAAGCGGRRRAGETIKVGIARSTSNAAELMALKHGYFKEAGIKLEWTTSTSPANVHRAAGAEPATTSSPAASRPAIFNALEKNLPITIAVRPRLDADRPQPDAAAGPQGHGQEPQGPQGQGDRQQRRRLGLDLRDRQDAGARRPDASPTSTSRSFRSPRWASRFKNKAIDAAHR